LLMGADYWVNYYEKRCQELLTRKLSNLTSMPGGSSAEFFLETLVCEILLRHLARTAARGKENMKRFGLAMVANVLNRCIP
jgi:hypothetical protein